jgi:hypothetical protein
MDNYGSSCIIKLIFPANSSFSDTYFYIYLVCVLLLSSLISSLFDSLIGYSGYYLVIKFFILKSLWLTSYTFYIGYTSSISFNNLASLFDVCF